jgi:hypothetical protein
MTGYAIVAHASTQIPPDRTITSIGAYGNVGYIVFTPAVPNLENCAYLNGDQVIIDWTADPNAKAMYATALAAYLAGHKVGFGVSGCYPGSSAVAYRVDVKP